jgi:hypothetical protein
LRIFISRESVTIFSKSIPVCWEDNKENTASPESAELCLQALDNAATTKKNIQEYLLILANKEERFNQQSYLF